MPQMIIRHRVNDYKKWKAYFDKSLALRKMAGEKSVKIFRNSEDPNDLSLVFEWVNVHKAVEYAGSESLRKAMKDAGVLETPQVYMTDEDLE
jgi:hypothetical protein